MKITTYKCDLCKTRTKRWESFWAEVTFKSQSYHGDDGTLEEESIWHLCRECKWKLMKFMTGVKD